MPFYSEVHLYKSSEIKLNFMETILIVSKFTPKNLNFRTMEILAYLLEHGVQFFGLPGLN